MLTNIEKPDILVVSQLDGDIIRQERFVRCTGTVKGFPCNKILTRIIVVTTIRGRLGTQTSISKIYPGTEIKFSTETKCNRCKNMQYTLNVI